MKKVMVLAALGLVTAAPVSAGPGGQFGQIMKRAQQFRDVQMTDEEEQDLGQAVS
jgi:hypothetical protein